MGRVFLTRSFKKFAQKNRISSDLLIRAVQEADLGRVHANLGGCLVKLRIARTGEGKSGGYRTIIAYKTNEKAFYLYGFSKNERESISKEEEAALRQYGDLLLSLSDLAIAQLVTEGKTIEIYSKEEGHGEEI